MSTNTWRLVNTKTASKCILFVSISLTTVYTTNYLFPTSVYADNPEIDQVNITVPVSCTLDGVGMNSHTANINNRDYETEIGSTTLTAYCNDVNGFSIYAIGYSNDEYGNTDMIGINTEELIHTGTTLDGTTSNWAMKLSTDPNATYPVEIQNSYNNYKVVPTTYTLVAKRESSTDLGTAAIGSILTTTYAASVSPTQVADTYIGKVRYILVHPYNTEAPQPPLGLCTEASTCMQQQTSASLAAKLPNVGDTVTLYDARDNQAYRVAKLADNKYWMVENLNIAGGAALSSEDTDFDSSYTLPTTGNWTATDGKLVLPASAIKNVDNNTLTDNTQFSIDNYAYVFNSGNKENCGSKNQNMPCYSYYSWDAATLGSGRILAAENTDADYSICPKRWRLPTTGSDSDNEWKRGDFYRLATEYGANMENSIYDSSAATGANFSNNAGPNTTPGFLFAGYYYGAGSFTSAGSLGYVWSSTSYRSTTGARGLYFSSSYVGSALYAYRKYGYSVRCLFKE